MPNTQTEITLSGIVDGDIVEIRVPIDLLKDFGMEVTTPKRLKEARQRTSLALSVPIDLTGGLK